MYIQDQVSYDQLDAEHLSFFRAIGVDSIHLELRGGAPAAGRKGGTVSSNTTLAQDLRAGRDCTDELAQAREKVEAHGMRLNNIFMPVWEEITLAEADMDEKIGYWCQMLACVGRAGISCVGWNFKPMGNFRTTSDVGRGGVQYSTFDYAEFEKNRPTAHEPPVAEAQMWERMERFLQAVVPAAEQAGAAAEKMGWTIPDEELHPKPGARGRPKKEKAAVEVVADTSGSDGSPWGWCAKTPEEGEAKSSARRHPDRCIACSGLCL